MVALVERYLDRVERGMVVTATELELDQGCRVEVLAADAAGRPAFVLAADPEGERGLAGRVLAVRAFIADSLPVLAGALPAAALDVTKIPRILVLCFDLPPSSLEQLSEMPAGSVEVYRLRPLRVGGDTIIGVQALLGVAPQNGRQAVPDGIDAPTRALASRWVELLHCLEPELRIEGDRYTRQYYWRRDLLAELAIGGPLPVVQVPESEQVSLRELPDCHRAIDLCARRYLELVRGNGAPVAVADAATQAVDDLIVADRVAADSVAADRATDTVAETGEEGAAADEEPSEPPSRLNFEPRRNGHRRHLDDLQHSVDSAQQLSDDEYAMLTES